MPCCQTHTYREKNFRNVDCVLANYTKVKDTQADYKTTN